MWCDGHVTREPFGWAPHKNIFDGNNLSAAVGWFGFESKETATNYAFDCGPKKRYGTP